MPYLSTDEDFLLELIDAQSENIILTTPVYVDGNIVDFEVVYGNQAAANYTRMSKTELVGARLFSNPALDQPTSMLIFSEMLKVYQTGEPLGSTYYNPVLNSNLLVTRKKFRDGVLSTTREYTREINIYQAKEQQELFNKRLTDASINGLLSTAAIRDGDGEIEDFIILSINPAFTRILGMTEEQVVGKRYLSLFPLAKQHGLFDANVQVVNTGVPARKQFYYKDGLLDAWFDISITTFGKGFLATFTDITESVQHKKAAEEFANYLQNIINTSLTGITVLEPVYRDNHNITDFRIKLANKSFTRYANTTDESLVGSLLSTYFPGYVDTPVFPQYVASILSGVQQQNETHYHKDGLDLWLDVRSTKFGDDLLVTFHDYTHLKKLQENFRLSAERLNAVFNASQSGMFTFSPILDALGEITDFRFVIVNRTLSSYVGQPPENLEGDLGSKWFPGYLTNGVFEMYRDSYLTGKTNRRNFHYNVDGINVYLDLMSTRVGNELLVTFTDFTPLKRLQLQMEEKMEELERSNRKLEDFAHAASHDLKEPIRKIQFFTDKLRKVFGNMDDNAANTFNKLELASTRMRLLIDDLLEYSHVSIVADLDDMVDLNQVVATVIEDLELMVQEKHATIQVDELPVIPGHKRQLQQLFQNLVSNALKYHHKASPPHVTISYCAVQDSVQQPEALLREHTQYHKISIADNGIGFEQRYAGQIFQMFQRLHGNSEFKGTGVGLAIVQKVVENHHGYIEAEGRPGEGATFDVYLPVELV
ncbi:PAS domain-containing sensor histidine kinase [Segetibacter sp. 3557_3]|uniref:PAS domain-containing sensor histidine kinase n=1 Tax=Segetibacter sp. 3557_3 TaxID=2547429 RepID=UPI001058C310|nr:ATP-binding protein [Segetibacter sp. 3557_3]TDH28979.1 PAS domain-containing sensor histidine kinase [Segetibacter sp. 3557_3]